MGEVSTLRKVVISSTFATGILFTAPQMVDAALGDQTLKNGMNHPDVKELQDALKQKGFFSHNQSTGFYGSITAEAVRKFQATHNLQVDGIAGPQTLSVLLQTSGQAQAAPVSTNTTDKQAANSAISKTSILRFGSNGASVQQLQEKLKEQGYYNHQITGQYGRVTESAVRAYQKAKNLVVDGIVGPQTLSFLLNEQAPQQETYQPVLPKVEENQEKIASETVQVVTTLRVGSSGGAVTDLQSKLRSLGLFEQEPTGYYGEVTATAVRNFQRLHKLTIDGIAGPNTINKLNQLATNQTPGKVENTQPTGSTGSPGSTQEAARPSTDAALVTNLLAEAATYIGVGYLWGGSSVEGFDCSGLMQFIFKQQGISIPRTVGAQWDLGKAVAEPAVGDLVFFETIAAGPSHNGIYIGNNQFVHSGSSTGVTIANMNSPYWSERYLGAKRLY